MHQRTILLIDDDRCWSSIISRYLTGQGYGVLSAGSCAEGIKVVRGVSPDCVLLDFNLPDMDGCEAAFHIRRDAAVRKTPIIMVSNDDSLEGQAYRDYQVDGFFYKMWPLGRLKGMLEATLRRVDMERGNLRLADLRLEGEKKAVFNGATFVAELSREQFQLLSLLVARSPEFVPESEINRGVFGLAEDADKADAIKMLAHRLRHNLGAKLGRRIKRVRGRGWIYLNPQESAAG